MKIIVSKFGGSSMRDHTAMLRSAEVSKKQNSFITLVSATYGTTDQLHALIDHAIHNKWDECEKNLFKIREKHFEILQNLTGDEATGVKLRELLSNLETLIKGVYLIGECSLKVKDRVVSFGERLSSLLFAEAMKMVCNDRKVELFDSREILITNSQFGKAVPILDEISKNCSKFFKKNDKIAYVGQGYIGSDTEGSTTTLGRGGSDYSAALFAEGVAADVLEIWTDVAGIATTDPRIVDNALAINEISYDEASEMAQYGAKILHPTTLVPAMRKEIPVFVGSSIESQEKGTWILREVKEKPLIRAITKRSNQALITIRTPKMLDTYGFMGKVFNVFTEYHVSVDCITTSEISVAFSVDKSTLDNKRFIQKLSEYGTLEKEFGFSLVSLIGNQILKTSGLAKRVFNSIENINVRMLCIGASPYNFNLLIKDNESDEAIKKLHTEFIG